MALPAVPADGTRYLGIEANPRGTRTNAQELTYVTGQISPQTFQVIRRYHGWTTPLIDSYEATIKPSQILWIYWYIVNAAQTWTTYTSITSGAQDTVIDAAITAIKAYGQPMFLTFHMEPENDTATAGSAAQYIAAWQYVWNRFHNQGVTNVSWIPVFMGSTYNAGTAGTWYPGDAFCDWLGVDAYNWFTSGGHTDAWKSFAQVFQGYLTFLNTKSKPGAIGETATVNGAAGASDKAAWYDGMRTTLKLAAWNQVKMVCYFNSQPFSTSPLWWLDNDKTGTAPDTTLVTHFSSMANDAMWTVGGTTGVVLPTVSIYQPAQNQVLNQAKVSIQAVVTRGDNPISTVALTLNGTAAGNMVYDTTLQRWKLYVAIPQGPSTATVTATDSAGNKASATVSFSNGPTGPSTNIAPTINVSDPLEGQVLTATQYVVSAEVNDPDGIDSTSVQISTDGGVTWATMSPPGGGVVG